MSLQPFTLFSFNISACGFVLVGLNNNNNSNTINALLPLTNCCCLQLEDDMSAVLQFCVDLHTQRQAVAAPDASAAAAADDAVFLLSTLCQLYLDIGEAHQRITVTCRLALCTL